MYNGDDDDGGGGRKEEIVLMRGEGDRERRGFDI